MHAAEITRILEDAVADRRLLTHPFYRRWEAGALSVGELAAYAGQYRYFEAALPAALAAVASRLPQGPARALVEANLADELGVPAPHLRLFDAFAESVGATAAAAGPAAAALADHYDAGADPVAVLAAIGAYEVQAADIAASKADGLRLRYGIGPDGTAFWDVHATMDRDHASWTAQALAALDAPPADVAAAAGRAADAWWTFLDEREAQSPAAACC